MNHYSMPNHTLLLHLDGSLPNLALMRIAAARREAGDHVELRRIKGVHALEPRLDAILVLAERYAAVRAIGFHPSMVIADVRLGPASLCAGSDVDRYVDSLRKSAPTPCPTGFWCVHDVLCPGARRMS